METSEWHLVSGPQPSPVVLIVVVVHNNIFHQILQSLTSSGASVVLLTSRQPTWSRISPQL